MGITDSFLSLSFLLEREVVPLFEIVVLTETPGNNIDPAGR